MIQQVVINGDQVIPDRNGSALVASTSQPGFWHAVKVVDGVHSCDCLGFQHREKCRHVRAVNRLALQSPLAAPSATFDLVEQTLAGAFDGGPKRRENLHLAEVTSGEDVTFAEWHERYAS